MRRQSFILGTAAATVAASPFLRSLTARADAVKSLRDAAAAKGILIGSNVRDLDLLTADPEFAALTVKQCSLIEAGHTFQWAQLRPSPTDFNFSKADAFVNWAQSHNLKIAECHLLWHHSFAKWLPRELNSSNWRDLLTNHIRTVVGRYAGKIYYWVVVNEAIELKDGRPDGLRNKLWTAVAGQDAIDTAFRTAAAADPKALLVYNDFGLDDDGPNNDQKRATLFNMVQGMKSRGVPIHAVGTQAHLNGGKRYQANGLGKLTEQFKSIGVKVFITELDTGDENVPGSDSDKDVTLAQVYKEYLTSMLRHTNVNTIMMWSLCNRYFWRNQWSPDGPHRGMPFGKDFNPTPVFNAIMDALNSAPSR